MNTIMYTHGDFTRDIGILIHKIKTSGVSYDILIGVNRGGCLPAVCLSHALKIPTTMIDYSTRDGVNVHPHSLAEYFWQLSTKYEYRKVLIVDDLIDSGEQSKRSLQQLMFLYIQMLLL